MDRYRAKVLFAVVIFYLLLAMETSVTSGVIVFDPPPSNASIVEGETATFTCVPKVNGTVVYVISWIISPVNAAHTSVNIVNTTTLAGADGVFLSGDERHLLITGVQRRLDRTRFTCQGITLSNERSFAPDVYLTVGIPPSAPQLLNLSNISPFSVDVTWDAPSDVGNPPEPLTYTVTLTNITDGTVLQYTLPSTQITLSNLLPGVQYNVSVYAKNSVGSGPPVTGVFRTNNSVPIIKQVTFSTEQSRLFVNITMVTNGGLPVTAYHITFNSRTTTFPSTSGASQFGMSLELLGVVLKEGNTFQLSVQVEGELGNSTQVDSSLAIINAPNVESTTNDLAVLVLSAIVGLFGALTLTAIVAAVIFGVCVCRNKKTKGVTGDSLAPPYESPVELNDDHKRKPQEQERGTQPNLQPNPSYEPLEVCVSKLGVKDTHKKNCVPEEQETSVDTKMQPNPSYEPIFV